MRKTAFTLLFLGVAALAAAPALAGMFVVTYVYDGDTVLAKGHDIEIKVRLVGIDAPEFSPDKRMKSQPYAHKAKNVLADLVLNKTVDIRGYGLGQYNRVLGVVTVDSLNVNLEILRRGLAEVYRGRPPQGFDLTPYLKAESSAKVANTGIWSLGEDYVPPRKWHDLHRKN